MYYVISISVKNGITEEYTISKSDSRDQAIQDARDAWEELSDTDREHTSIEVRIPVVGADWEDDTCDNWNYNTLEWRDICVVFWRWKDGEGFSHNFIFDRLTDAISAHDYIKESESNLNLLDELDETEDIRVDICFEDEVLSSAWVKDTLS